MEPGLLDSRTRIHSCWCLLGRWEASRVKAYRPSGNSEYEGVAVGNVQAARLALLLLLADALGVWFVVEQPAGSCLMDLAWLKRWFRKRTLLFSNLSCNFFVGNGLEQTYFSAPERETNAANSAQESVRWGLGRLRNMAVKHTHS
jgi:hypothetical protein